MYDDDDGLNKGVDDRDGDGGDDDESRDGEVG